MPKTVVHADTHARQKSPIPTSSRVSVNLAKSGRATRGILQTARTRHVFKIPRQDALPMPTVHPHHSPTAIQAPKNVYNAQLHRNV